MKKRITIILIVAITLITALLVSLVVFFSNRNDSSSNPTNQSTSNDEMVLIVGSDKVTEYFINDEFICPTIYAKYSDNRIINVSNSDGISVTGYDLSKSGSQVVNITYNDGELTASCSYNIYVYSATPKYLKATYTADEIYWGATIDRDKLSVIVYYSNTINKQVYDYSIEYNSQPANYGLNTVKITYKELTTSFDINVIPKTIDSDYATIENETKAILGKLGIENPSCPKDYSFQKDIYGNGYIKTSGKLEYSGELTAEYYMSLCAYLFSDYTLAEGPELSYDIIFPSTKIVLVNGEISVSATIYISQFNGETKYTLFVRNS